MPACRSRSCRRLSARLEEDIGAGDVTTNSVVPEGAAMTGRIIAKQAGVVAGLDVARATCLLLDQRIQFADHVAESARVERWQALATVSGPARALLTAERTALNCLGRMSGIATLTRQFVDAVAGTRAVILDTRKTAPGCRAMDKLAVRRGGGQNHRYGPLRYGPHQGQPHRPGRLAGGGRATRARQAETGLLIGVEARSLDDVEAALGLGITRIMLDNMSVEDMRRAVELTAGRARLEASGNVRLDNVR